MVPQKPKKISNPSGAGQKEVEPDPTPLEPKWGVQGLWKKSERGGSRHGGRRKAADALKAANAKAV